MGHANLSNISKFFVRRLYAKGRLSIRECCQQLVNAGEELHASEGRYKDEEALAIGVVDVVHYLTRSNPCQDGYSGPDDGGPWIKPSFSPIPPPSIMRKLSKTSQSMLRNANRNISGHLLHKSQQDILLVIADKVEEDGFQEWAQHIRNLPLQCSAHKDWLHGYDDHFDYGEPDSKGDAFDNIHWVFAQDYRSHYQDVPLLGNVTH